MKPIAISPISDTALELGVVSASRLHLDANNSNVNFQTGLWPFEATVQKINQEILISQYNKYVNSIMAMTTNTIVRTIIFVGYESLLIDIIAKLCKDINIVIITNSPNVDNERIAKNYHFCNIHIVDPYQAARDYGGINSIIVVSTFSICGSSVLA